VRGGNPARLRDGSKRDFSTAQTDTFAGAKAKEKASVCFGRNDKFAAMLMAGKFAVTLTNDKFAAMLTGY
jgi:hypothetical protein